MADLPFINFKRRAPYRHGYSAENFPAIDPGYGEDKKPVPVVAAPPPTPIENDPVIDPATLSLINKPTTPIPPEPVDPLIEEMRHAPNVTYKDGRPDTASGPDTLEAQRALQTATNDYIPQKAKGWKRWLPVLANVGAMFGGAIAHDPNTVARATANVGRGVFNPAAADEDWKRQQQAKNAAAIDQTLDQQKAEAQVEELKTRPKLAERRVDLQASRDQALKDQREWQRRFQDRKQDTAEDYIQWKMKNGDRRATTAEGQMELRSEYQDLWRDFQKERIRQGDERIKQGDVRLEQGQERIDKMGAGGGAVKASIKGAAAALSRFGSLTTRIEKAKEFYRGAPEGVPVIQALYNERDLLENNMKSQYGDYLKLDQNGKPNGLKEGMADEGPKLSIEGAISHFKLVNKRPPTAKEISNMQALIDGQ